MNEEWLKPKNGAKYAGGVALRTYWEWYQMGLKRIKIRGVTLTKKEWIDQFLSQYLVADESIKVDEIVKDVLKDLK